jgi:hypothetical protein
VTLVNRALAPGSQSRRTGSEVEKHTLVNQITEKEKK